MPSDVAAYAELEDTCHVERLPRIYGLGFAIVVSGGLWALIIQGVRLLF